MEAPMTNRTIKHEVKLQKSVIILLGFLAFGVCANAFLPTFAIKDAIAQRHPTIDGRVAVLEEEVCRIQGKYFTVGRHYGWTKSSCRKLGYNKPLK